MVKKSRSASKPAPKGRKPAKPKKPVDAVESDSQAAETESTGEAEPAAETASPPEDDLQHKYDRLSKQHDRVKKANAKRHKFQNVVDQATQGVKSAQAALKKAIGDRDRSVLELDHVIEDVKSGQQVLPGTEDDGDETSGTTPTVATPVGTADNWPISELGNKRLKEIVGADVFSQAKESGDPIGLSDKQLESLESHDWATIGDLEKTMREDSWWHKKVAKNPDAQIIQRVTSTLLAFRKVHPHAEPPATVLEKLAEQNSTKEVEKTEPASAA